MAAGQLSQCRRPRVRYEKRADIHETFLSLACALTYWQPPQTIRTTGSDRPAALSGSREVPGSTMSGRPFTWSSMPLAVATRLGPYEIVAPIGAGGMGEVYRARDTKLNRDVAIKVLPDLFANDPERLARFRREAQLLASLNHPNIAHIHGLEDSGGVPALVMELVEGEDLAQRLKRGAIPLDEALPVATQIIEALAAAHEQGVIHRDLKPANITIRPDGAIKILDFGLAKALDPLPSSPAAELANSPTLTTPAMLSGVGVILGTAAYMSPEQTKGRAVDKRSDVWAFGCVLYEMLTGRPAFEGNSVSEIVADVLKTEPDWRLLPHDTPASITRLLRRCLQKDAAHRLRDIADASLEIREVGVVDPPSGDGAATARARRRERLAWASAVVVFGLSAVVAIAWALLPKPPPPLVRLEIATPPTTDLASLAISPDGRTITFVATFEGRPQLWLRPLDATTSRPLVGTDDARDPFWSPDSRSIGFFAAGHLKRIDVEGGSPRVLADTVSGALGVGGASWGRDGTILYAPAQTLSSIYRVSSNGGGSTAVTPPVRGGFYSLPQFLPDGRQFMYSVVMSDIAESADHRGIFVSRIDASEPRRLLDADAAWYSAGYLVFVRQGALFAQRFDPVRLSLEGHPWTLADPFVSPTIGTRPAVSTSDAGLIIYRAGSGVRLRQFVWFDRSGAEIAKVGEPIPNGLNPSLSPDGRRVALHAEVDANVDIWLLEPDRGLLNRFTTDPTVEAFPIWSPDGSLIVFNSIRAGGNDLYQKPLDGGAPETLLLGTSEIKQPCDWSPDGRFLLFRSRDRSGPDVDLWALPMAPGSKPFPVVKTKFNETDGQFSPDSQWIAYQSDESGRFEIYVQPFAGPGGRERISTNGGAQVRWRHDGKELFYIALDGRLMAVPVRLMIDSRRVEVGAPAPLFATRIGGAAASQTVLRQQYVVSADGQRFLMSTVPEVTSSTPITVIMNWKPQS
jgi:Tol biopolymer transport system component/transposase